MVYRRTSANSPNINEGIWSNSVKDGLISTIVFSITMISDITDYGRSLNVEIKPNNIPPIKILAIRGTLFLNETKQLYFDSTHFSFC